MKVLILDNYDSFTYNLYQFVGEILLDRNTPFELDVKRNDSITLPEIQQAGYSHIIISPGPGTPEDPAYFGICAETIKTLGPTLPILGVCLGMQGIAWLFGGKIIRAQVPMHGKTSPIQHDGKGVFTGLPQNLEVMRYHSLIAAENSIPDCLTVTATCTTDAGKEIMGLRHNTYPIEGIQFHPESFATEGGKTMLANFLK